MRCAVVGVGRMGQHHARVYSKLDETELVAVVDQNLDRATEIADQWGGTPFQSVDELLATTQIDAVTVAVPTVWHLQSAEPLLRAGVACLIEKPLGPNAKDAQTLADLADETQTILQVGHIERYNPAVRALAEGGTIAPRFIEVHRVSPMTFRSVDVGVVLDMMIHDLDLILMLTGEEPESVQACGVAVVGEAEDVCNARLSFPSGCVANVTASRLALKTERKIRIVSNDAYMSIDYGKKSGLVIRKNANEHELISVRKELAAGKDLSDVDYESLVNVETLKVDQQDQLEMEVRDFIQTIRSGNRPTVDAHAGFAAVRTAERIVTAAREHASTIGTESLQMFAD